MTCNTIIYDFVSGTRVQLPTFSRAGAAGAGDDRHGLRAILRPDEDARALLQDHIRMLSERCRPVAS